MEAGESPLTWGVDGYGLKRYWCKNCEIDLGYITSDDICTLKATAERNWKEKMQLRKNWRELQEFLDTAIFSEEEISAVSYIKLKIKTIENNNERPIQE